MRTPNYAERISLARKRAGKDPREIATQLNISLASYYDLEGFDDEVLTCISLRQVEQLCEVLHINSLDLLSPEQPIEELKDRLTLRDLIERARLYLREHHLTIEQFEEKTGWDFRPALENWERSLDWNVDGLQTICESIGVNWLAVFPISL